MDEESVMTILNYLEENLFEPKANWPKKEFNQRSYSRWAVDEILSQISDYPCTPVVSIVEGFLFQMFYFSSISKTEAASLIFSIATETAEDILLLLE